MEDLKKDLTTEEIQQAGKAPEAVKVPDVTGTSGVVGTVQEKFIIPETGTTTILTPEVVPVASEGLVTIKVAHPKEHKGEKHLVDGQTYQVSPETAKELVENKKIAKIVK